VQKKEKKYINDERIIALMNYRKKIVVFILLVVALSLVGSRVSACTEVYSSETNILSTHILTAYYSDLEDKGVENDIFTSIYISFDSPYYYNHLYCYVELTLPSGYYYSYLISIEFYGVYEITLPIYMYNHATESGDYILYVASFFACSNHYLAESLVIFDPPGGTDGADPPRIEVG